MNVLRSRSIAIVASVGLAAQPVMAVPYGNRDANISQSFVAAATFPVPFASASASSLAPMSVSIVPISAIPASMLETQRHAISEIIVALGEEEDRAREMASQLTPEDLSVLLANPRMMQKAGDAVLIIGALLVVGVIVALVLMADSSTVVVSL